MKLYTSVYIILYNKQYIKHSNNTVISSNAAVIYFNTAAIHW